MRRTGRAEATWIPRRRCCLSILSGDVVAGGEPGVSRMRTRSTAVDVWHRDFRCFPLRSPATMKNGSKLEDGVTWHRPFGWSCRGG
nr:hypothetical protein Iba_chr09fCG9060 [Ipomoea batatas]